jgi:hypothetical protein
MFSRFIGIDYSGAETPDSSLKGLQVASVVHEGYVRLVAPPAGPKKYWTRQGIAHWLVETLSDGPPAVVGIDHGFSFPAAYFTKYKLPNDWTAFLDDFCLHWPTDQPDMYVDFVRNDQRLGKLVDRTGANTWRRVTEVCSGSARSVFHFDVHGSVAKSTHAGLPWLRYLRQHVRRPVHFWPFDGWIVPPDRPVVLEVYPRLWRPTVPNPGGMTAHERDARIIARTLCDADVDGRLVRWLAPVMPSEVRAAAEVEGWILGVDPARLPDKLPKPVPASATRSERRRLSPSAFVSAFFGLTLAMYPPFDDVPRVHASNNRGGSNFDIMTGTAIDGDLGPIASRLVVEWINRHREELLENWRRGRAGLPRYRVAPLE